MDLDEALLECEELMEKAVNFLKGELQGVRTGRASTGLVEHVHVDYYGSSTELRQLASISAPEPMQLLIKPFDASSLQQIGKAIQAAGLGLNPIIEGKQVRINLPPLTGERRQQLIASVKHMGEQAKVSIRNARRDANKHVDQAEKDKSLHLSEDDVKETKEEIQELVKKYEHQVEEAITAKVQQIQDV